MKRMLVCIFVLWVCACGAAAESSDFVVSGGTLIAYTGSGGDVVIPADMGITRIGDGLFIDNATVTSVFIPEGVTTIGADAFNCCLLLERITLPSSLQTLGELAFAGLPLLEEIALPDGLVTIGPGAFKQCTALTEVKIPDGVASIGREAFMGCTSLEDVALPSALKRLEIYVFAECPALKHIELHEGLTYIGEGVFYRSGIESLVVPDSVVELAKRVFIGAESLTEAKIGSGVLHLPESAFQYCYALEKVNLPAGLQSIGGGAFFSCTSLKEIELPDGIQALPAFAFSICESLVSVKLPSSLRQIDDGVFSNCTSLKELYIPAGVTSIGSTALEASGLEKLVIPETVCGISNRAITNGIASPAVYCYEYSEAETWAIHTGLSVVLMDEVGFAELGGRISLADMGMIAGNQAPLLASVVPDSGRFMRIYRSSAPEIVSIDDQGMMTAHKAGSAEITLTIEGVSDICMVTVAENSGSLDDFVISGSTLTAYTGSNPHVEIPAGMGITSISSGAFCGNEWIQSVVIPEGVTYIGNNTFEKCHALRSVTIPSTVKSIGGNAFFECSSLEKITLPEGMQSIEGYAFYECGTLKHINLPDSLTYIGASAFAYCASLEGEFDIPKGVTAMEKDVFASCQQIRRIRLHDGVTKIGWGTFRNCESLVEINIPEGIVEVPDSAFYGCGSLRSLYVPDSVKKIGNEAFGCCFSLVDLRLPEAYETEGIGLFEGCAFERWAVPDGLTSIPYNMFSGNENLKVIDIPDTVTEFEDWSLSLLMSMESFTVPDGITRIGEAVFINCPKLTKIYIPDSVTSFGWRIAFMGIQPYDKKPTIYCSEGSAAEAWAKGEGFPVIYTEGKSFKQMDGTIELPEKIALALGEKMPVNVRLWPDKAEYVPAYASSDESVFTVSEEGMLTAHACGRAQLIVELDGIKAVSEIQVYAPVSSFSLESDVMHMTMKERAVLRVTDIQPARSDEPLTFFVDDTAVLSVDESGNVTAKGEGKACVTVRAANGYSQSCIIYVHQPKALVSAGEMKLNYSEWVVAVAGLGEMRLKAKLTDGSSVSGLTYESSDARVATVDENGVVHGIAKGRAKIMVRSSLGLSASCEVLVEDELASAMLPAALAGIEAEAFTGDMTLEAVILPENAVKVGERAFAGCENLRYVMIPETVCDIAENAFDGCGALTVLCDASSYAEQYAKEHGMETYIRN